MKKLIYFTFAAFALAALASCEPELIKGPEAAASVASSELQSAFKIDGQFADAACTQAQADGNYIMFSTSPARTVQITNLKADGTKNILATGASGVFNITPKRGQSSTQAFTVSTINQDASVVSFESTVNVYVPADLAPEVKVLTGESGQKAWKWYTIDGACWGNAGYIGVAGQANVAAGEIPGKWWGCTPEELETEQIAHTGNVVYGYGDSNAYMVFNEDGECISYKSDGTQIVKGTYSLNDYDPSGENYLYGTLVTTDAPILMPFRINSGGTRVNEFEVVYIDPNMMTLIDRNGNAEWGWSESTWWRFKNASDADAALAGNGQRAWTYNAFDGATWGNAGYIGVGGQANVAAGEIPGKWWGCVPGDLETEQVQHSGGVVYGYGSDDAYMVFDNAMGTVTSFAADGSQIASSAYSVENFDWQGEYKMGDLLTPGDTPGILFPFIINTGGSKASEYELLYLDGTLMTLIYKGDNAEWGWGECTWWRFQPKK
ncbi:MAG: hypothetical protein K6G39_00500 [Bacteroidales bacterium]|nr:hypothetical protein [Bacteroidales bacterium]